MEIKIRDAEEVVNRKVIKGPPGEDAGFVEVPSSWEERDVVVVLVERTFHEKRKIVKK